MKIAINIKQLLLWVFVLFASISISTSVLAEDYSGEIDHAALAAQHKHLTNAMRIMIEQQKKILNNKLRTSFFGRNGSATKKCVNARMRQYVANAVEHLAKAEFHSNMAAVQMIPQSMLKTATTPYNFQEES